MLAKKSLLDPAEISRPPSLDLAQFTLPIAT